MAGDGGTGVVPVDLTLIVREGTAEPDGEERRQPRPIPLSPFSVDAATTSLPSGEAGGDPVSVPGYDITSLPKLVPLAEGLPGGSAFRDESDLERQLQDMLDEAAVVPDDIIPGAASGPLQEVARLKREVLDEAVPNFDDALRKRCEGQIMLVGSIDTKTIEREEQRLESQRIRALQEQAARDRAAARAMVLRERAAKAKVLSETRETMKGVRLREERLRVLHEAHLREQQIAFRHAESNLHRVLLDKMGTLRSFYGEVQTADDLYGGARSRKYTVEWTGAPQPIRIRIDTIRAVKNKLAAGRYVVLVSLFDKLGGVALHWSGLDRERWCGNTPNPVLHSGKFYDLDLSFSQDDNRIYVACPSRNQIRPSMALVFELFLCRGRHSPSNQVVGWGAFPLSLPDSNIVHGRYRVPLLRGPVDTSIVKYDQIERRVCNDLDNWLANLYFDVRRLSGILPGMPDVHVSMQFTNRLLHIPEQDAGKAAESTTIVQVEQTSSSSTSTSMFDENPEWASEGPSFLEPAHPTLRAKQLEPYRFHLSTEHETRWGSALPERLRFLKNELLADLSLTKWRTADFWLMMTLIGVVCWFRIYTHYVAEWLLLNLLTVPVLDFSIKGYSVLIRYPVDAITMAGEIAVVLIGGAFNLALFVMMSIGMYTAQQVLDSFPASVSRIMFAGGLATILDPILVFIVDASIQNWNGDAFKLYNYFQASDGSGVPGIFLTLFLLSIYLVVAVTAFYTYILRVHMNGRMLDVYHRLRGDPSSFFVPEDMEISLRNLRWIVGRAQKWKGADGSSRKIVTTVFTSSDHLDATFQERSIHLAIYTQAMNGERELFRHFLRRADGTILELFDSADAFDKDATDGSMAADPNLLDEMLALKPPTQTNAKEKMPASPPDRTDETQRLLPS